MYECYMNDVIHESIYDICTNIYDSICYNNIIVTIIKMF